MKKITLSNQISFCFGVKKSLDLINKIITSKKYKNIYMLGEIIHNEQVIDNLKNKGLKIVNNFNKLPEIPDNSILIIQSHGVKPDIYSLLDKMKINYIDSTCPLVKKIHKTIKALELEGFYPVILGNKNHTEVIGISGYTIQKPIIINSKEEVTKNLFKSIKKAGIVMQSTFYFDKVLEIVDEIKKYVDYVKIIDTICEPTKSRQKEIMENSKKYKSVVVIGSKNSSNTKKLYNIARKNNPNTFLITSIEEIDNIDFSSLFPLFLTSGASTPYYLIEDIKNRILTKSNHFYKFLKEHKKLIDNEINKIFEKKIKDFSRDQNNLTEMDFNIIKILKELNSFCLRDGKRIRPLLLIWSYLAFGGNKRNLKKIITIAATIEIMHAALLIHDDIIDNSGLRRGKPSFHIVMQKSFSFNNYKINNNNNNNNIKNNFTDNVSNHTGSNIAIICADILFFMCMEIISGLKINLSKKNQFFKIFNNCYYYTGIGQIYDILVSDKNNIDIEFIKNGNSYSEKINLLKTSFYTIYYPVLMGYILSLKKIDTNYYKDKNFDKIKNFSIPLGIGFQLRDDIISTFKKEEKSGKSDYSDIEESKITDLIEQTIKSLDNKELDNFKKIFFKQNKTKNEIYYIKETIKNTEALKITKKKMNNLFNEALQNIDNLSISERYKIILKDLIEFLKIF